MLWQAMHGGRAYNIWITEHLEYRAFWNTGRTDNNCKIGMVRTMDQMTPLFTNSALIDDLRAIVGDRGLVLGEDVAIRSCDPFRPVPAEGGIIVRPADTQEVSRVMALCHQRGQPVVTHGGRTGVAGGAFASANELVLSLERMNKIEEIDVFNQCAVAQAGVPIEALHNAASDADLLYPIDLGSKGTATLGGTIATNAGGNRVLRWGMTRANLLGIEVVLADGTIVSALNRLTKNNTGYDMKHIFAGTEGTLGIVTRAVVRLVPKPVSQQVAVVAVPSYDEVLGLLREARKLPSLSAFEVMWADYYDIMAASDTGRRPLEPGQPFYILLESMGYNEEQDEQQFMSFLEQALEDELIVDAVTSQSLAQVDEMWKLREGGEVLLETMWPIVSSDISVDVRKTDEYVNKVREAMGAAYPDFKMVTFGHLGDGNIHIGIHVGPETVAEEQNVERILYDTLKGYDSAVTAEHGIGQVKKKFLPEHVSPGAMKVMEHLRDALDPGRILNRNVLL